MEADLRGHIRWLLETGALPLRSEEQKLYGGRGSGQRCDCCGRGIAASEVLYEVESPEHSLLAMHLQCFEGWEAESSGRHSNAAKGSPYLRCRF